ncbi:MAG: hypothetical protein Q8P26_03730 [Candidatus Levybacteria bacterium]|nr:hypothetical protein [Candidatus Levybacteria bacterium]
MRKMVITIIISIALVLVSAFLLFNQSSTPKVSIQIPSPTPQDTRVNIKASFTIITGNITRSFQAEKYHNQSSDVYIESSNPTIINVAKSGITWNDFFKTLPMKLTEDCLITGDGETLCNGNGRALKFYLNDIETPDLLDKEIRDGDKALINFSSQ